MILKNHLVVKILLTAVTIVVLSSLTLPPNSSLSSQQNAPIETKVEANSEAINLMHVIAGATAAVGFIGGLLTVGSYVVRLTNTISDIKANLKDEFAKSNADLTNK